MSKQETERLSRTLKSEKDSLKKYFKEINFEASNESHHAAQLVVPPIIHKSSKVDWSFQQYFNGFILSFDGELLVVDPAASFYSRLTSADLTINDVRAIFVSHKHIDHIVGLPLMLDMLLKLEKQIDLIMPQDAFDEVLSTFLKDQLINGKHRINLILISDDEHNIGSKIKWQPLKSIDLISLHHSDPNTFGFGLSIAGKKFVYMSDTGYSKLIETSEGTAAPNMTKGDFVRIVSKHEEIKQFAQDAAFAVMNINDLHYNRHAHTHLIGWDILDIFDGGNLQQLILQHIPTYDARGELSDTMYKSFFSGEKYACVVPGEGTTKIDL